MYTMRRFDTRSGDNGDSPGPDGKFSFASVVMSKRAAFLDRDGTIIDDTGFIRRIEDVKLLPKAAKAVKRLNDADWRVIVVTNQSGVARGLLTEKDVAATNKRMIDLLTKEGATVDAVYYCPHLPEGMVPNYAKVCDCRKPRPGMLLQAAEEHGIDLAASVMIGDAPRDAEAGLAAGTRAILLTESAARAEQVPDACGQAPDLFAAVTEILKLPVVATRVEKTPKKTVDAKQPARAKRKARKSKKSSAAAKPEEETAVSAEKAPIPIRRAPKEFTPEPETDETTEEVEAPVAAAPETETTSVREGVPCGRCGAVIPPEDIAGGRAADLHGVRLCAACIAALEAQEEISGEATNDDLLRELRNITRALTYQRFSTWHILGAIGQAMAVGSALVAFFSGGPPLVLLYAVFFQLLALTCFILGRQ